MPSDYLPEDLTALWKELATHVIQVPPELLSSETDKLRNGLHRRFLIGSAAALIVLASFTIFFFIFANRMQRFGAALTVLGSAYVLLQLWSRRSVGPPDPAQMNSLQYYRMELERQRDFHRGRWFWSRLVAFAPGPIAFLIGFAQTYRELAIYIWVQLGFMLALCLTSLPLNLRIARKYQRRLDALDRMTKQDSF